MRSRHPPTPPAELQTHKFSKPQWRLNQHRQSVIQPGGHREQATQANAAGIHLMHFAVLKPEALEAVHIGIRHLRQRIDFLKEHYVRLCLR